MKGTKLFLLLLLGCSRGQVMDPFMDMNEYHGRRFQQCYHESDLYMNRKPGRAELYYHINPEGKVTEAKLTKADFKDANLVACLTGVVKRTKFEPSKDGKPIDAYYPLNFYPELQ